MDLYYNSLGYFQKLETALAQKLGLPALSSGGQVIRNEKGWRENEKLIEYIWVVQISRSFIGWGGLFSVKFNENKFREHANKEELVQGIFTCDPTGVGQFYAKTVADPLQDMIDAFKFNLFEANKGIALDGVSYQVRVIAPNVDTFIHLHNPNTPGWVSWEQEVWAMGKALANESGNAEMVHLFRQE